MDRAAVFHIHRIGSGYFLADDPLSCSDLSGQKPLSHGNMKAIPAIAAYERWKPASRMDCDAMMRCISNDARSIEPVLCIRPLALAASPMTMNRKARTIDAPAPVARTYRPHAAIVMHGRIMRKIEEFPKMDSAFLRIPYMIPR